MDQRSRRLVGRWRGLWRDLGFAAMALASFGRGRSLGCGLLALGPLSRDARGLLALVGFPLGLVFLAAVDATPVGRHSVDGHRSLELVGSVFVNRAGRGAHLHAEALQTLNDVLARDA